MNMNENEEMIEDITEVEEVIPTNNEQINSNEVVTEQVISDFIDEVVTDNNSSAENVESLSESEPQQQVETKKKSKAPALIILFILLILDIAAITIYIIGIDKVISFIK